MSQLAGLQKLLWVGGSGRTDFLMPFSRSDGDDVVDNTSARWSLRMWILIVAVTGEKGETFKLLLDVIDEPAVPRYIVAAAVRRFEDDGSACRKVGVVLTKTKEIAELL